MPVNRTTIGGSPYLGVYLRLSESAALLPNSASSALERLVHRLFGLPVIRTTVDDSEILGALVALNSHGAVVGESLRESEWTCLQQGVRVAEVPSRHNAMGNNVLANDFGAVVHPELDDRTVTAIGTALRVPVSRGTVAGLPTVGMAASATNRGVVVHPRTTPEEAVVLHSRLQVPVYRSTANFGIPVVGACLVATSRAVLAGLPTTPVEIVHLQEGFQVYD